jgi:hypothetical protein
VITSSTVALAPVARSWRATGATPLNATPVSLHETFAAPPPPLSAPVPVPFGLIPSDAFVSSPET